ncbi:hypothetical protein TIFTF001_056273 [Ficus carica]|uniref:Uncharacterized protein n=1 Tax=Ficus carica TaxID=3494 RepID=A0AA88ENN0_FICCA|nr:hypothetical protein TIFTF001_056273 [Ficus carica]
MGRERGGGAPGGLGAGGQPGREREGKRRGGAGVCWGRGAGVGGAPELLGAGGRRGAGGVLGAGREENRERGGQGWERVAGDGVGAGDGGKVTGDGEDKGGIVYMR